MAWTVTPVYAGPNWETYTVEASAAPDSLVVIPHGLGRVPNVCILTPRNDAAAGATIHIEGVTDTQFEVHKAVGVGAGMIAEAHVSTLRHPH